MHLFPFKISHIIVIRNIDFSAKGQAPPRAFGANGEQK
jgi:hypothetical protein